MNNEVTTVLNVIDYMEMHLKEKFSLEDIATHVHYTVHAVQNIFTQNVGISIGDYIKKRRLTEVAKQLIKTNRPIIYLAVEYNYGSQESFSRAFKDQFGISPSKYRMQGQERYFSLYNRVTEEALLAMQNFSLSKIPLIKIMPSCMLKGRREKIDFATYDEEMMWCKIYDTYSRVSKKSNQKMHTLFQYTKDLQIQELNEENTNPTLFIGVDQEKSAPDGEVWEWVTIPEGKYALFEYKGPRSSLCHAYKYIFSIWMPYSAYTVRDAFDFDRYQHMDDTTHNVTLSICVPVK
ncbi:MAG: helix-turn-helix domain-containing protein [Cellulosilyticaceae bacterium]